MTLSVVRFRFRIPYSSSSCSINRKNQTNCKPKKSCFRSADVEETEGISTPTEERGDLLLRNIWKHQTDCILDVRITNLDALPFIRSSETGSSPSFPLKSYVFRNYKLHEVKNQHCNCTLRATYLCIRGSRILTIRMSKHTQCVDVLPIGEQTTNIVQNWTKIFREQIEKRRWDKINILFRC